MMREAPSWATSTGLPTEHAIRSAVIVATIIGTEGAPIGLVKESYWRRAGGGQQSPHDLENGQDLLTSCGLVVLDGDWLMPTIESHSLIDADVDDAAVILCSRALSRRLVVDSGSPGLQAELNNLVPDEWRRQHLLDGLMAKFDDMQQRLVGSIGEELVMEAAQSQLRAIGRHDLAQRVQQVSMHNDCVGFDIAAPRLDGSVRLLEVKSTTASGPRAFVYVSRNEFEVSQTNQGDWSLVVCKVTDMAAREGTVIGWCSSTGLADQAPVDVAPGRWESMKIELATADLIPSLPSPFL
jgi:hypothetical protein